MDDLLHKRITHLEHKVHRLKNNPAPTVPKYDLAVAIEQFGRVSETWKTHPVWWNLDDTYNGNGAWATATAGDVSYLAKFDGTAWQYWTGPAGGIHGVYTPSGPAPGTPYYPSGPVPVGGVGNNFITRVDNAFDDSFFSGDQIAVVAYRLSAFDAPTVVNYSTPYLEDHYILYENDGVTIIHDFGALQIDLGPYNPPLAAYPPGFYFPPSSGFYLGTVWTVP